MIASELASKLPTRPKGAAVKPKASMGPLTKLAPIHQLLIEYTVHGVPENKKRLLDYHYRAAPTEQQPDRKRQLLPNEPLTCDEAARVLGVRLRHARHLFSQPVFIKAHNAAIEAIRNGAKVAAMNKVAALVSEQGDGSAAWAKVNLNAAQLILGDSAGNDAKPSVQVNVGLQLNPGIVIRLPADAPTSPLELTATQVNADD